MRSIFFLLLALSPQLSAFAITNSQALADADAYIAQHRRGPATVKIAGLAPGTPVQIRQTRLDWNYGAAIHKDFHLDRPGYVPRFLENFNTVVAGGPGYWIENEKTRDSVTLGGLDRVVDFAQSNNLYLRGHHLFSDSNSTQPSWVKSLSNSAMRQEITERIDYYAPLGFDELDVYNESFNGGELGGSGTYWNRLGRAGIAGIYNEVAAETDAKLFVNDYAALQGAHQGFAQHIDQLRAAGAASGYGDIIDGIGLEYYADGADANIPKNFRESFDTMASRGLPVVVTEWGLMESASPASLRTSLKMAFGHPAVTGFSLWDWTDLPEWSFAEASALYRVSGNTFTLTETGKAWQDQLGIKDWDGTESNGWRTNLDTTAGGGGQFNFTGYYGDYTVTAGGKSYGLTLSKGISNYVLGTSPGDFNADGRVDAADFTVWRDRGGTQAEYQQWRAAFGSVGAASAVSVPEPAAWFLVALALVAAVLFVRRRNR